jgi:hypothetical protein
MRTSARRATLLQMALLATAAATPWAGSARAAEPPAEVQTRTVALGDLGQNGDLAFSEIFDVDDSITFGVPEYWKPEGDGELHLHAAWSPQLLPDVSTINVFLDGKPVGTVKLAGDPGGTWLPVVRLPLAASRVAVHTLEFRSFHRAHVPCEPTEIPGLWSRILSDSFIQMRYRPIAPKLSLSRWPYPFRDERDPEVRRTVIALRASPTVEEVQAAGYIASWLGHNASWRPLDLVLHQGPLADAPPGNVIFISRGDQPDPRWPELVASATGPGLEAFTAIAQRKEPWPASGILMEIPREGTRGLQTVLAVVGSTGKGLAELGVLLAGQDSSSLATGVVQLVNLVEASPPIESRRWARTVPPEETFQLKDLGLHDKTIYGPRKAVATIPLSIIPDDQPMAGRVRLHLNYSYSAQVDTDRSRIDVALNDAYVGGAALGKIEGQNRQSIDLELPAHEIGPQSELQVSFTLLHRSRPPCIGEPGPAVWGTVHMDSTVTMPRDRWISGTDMTLLHYGGFPFGTSADLAGTRFVLAKKPSPTEVQMFLWFAAEFGRVARGDRFHYAVSLGGPVDATKGEHLVVLDSSPDGALLRETSLLDKLAFRPMPPKWAKVDFAPGGAVELAARSDVAYIQEVALAGPPRVALVAWAAKPELFQRVGKCAESGLFERLRGQLARVGSCEDIATISSLERKVIGRKPIAQAAYEPVRNNYWLIFGALVGLIGVGLLARGGWIFLRRRRVVPAIPGDGDGA